MKRFVDFIQESMSELNSLTYIMPHIIHYYIIYLHPYYDFNGRMARMIAYWYIVKCHHIKDKMPVYSEAINYNSQTKALYYKAIENARDVVVHCVVVGALQLLCAGRIGKQPVVEFVFDLAGFVICLVGRILLQNEPARSGNRIFLVVPDLDFAAVQQG